jgi:hypothetical protein
MFHQRNKTFLLKVRIIKVVTAPYSTPVSATGPYANDEISWVAKSSTFTQIPGFVVFKYAYNIDLPIVVTTVTSCNRMNVQ